MADSLRVEFCRTFLRPDLAEPHHDDLAKQIAGLARLRPIFGQRAIEHDIAGSGACQLTILAIEGALGRGNQQTTTSAASVAIMAIEILMMSFELALK